MNTASIVQKLWNYCNVLRDDGMSYGDYPGSSPGQANSGQLTYLLFLKMADERTRQLLLGFGILRRPNSCIHAVVRCATSRHPWRSQVPYNQKSPVPEKYSWPSLTPALSRKRERGILFGGDELFDHYRKLGGAPAL